MVVPPCSSHSHSSVTVRVVTGTSSFQFVGSVRHSSISVIVQPPGHTGQEIVDVTVTVVVGQMGQGVVHVGYGQYVDVGGGIQVVVCVGCSLFDFAPVVGGGEPLDHDRGGWRVLFRGVLLRVWLV